MAVNGVPISNDGLVNMYPGLPNPYYDYDDIVHGPGTTSQLFQVQLSGGFSHPEYEDDIAEYIDSLSSDSTNRWEILHSNSNITLTMNHTTDHPTVNTKMRMYKAAVELERLLLVNLLPFATHQFSISVSACSQQDFETKVRDMYVCYEEWTPEWLNDATMARIYTWITTVVPTYVLCWMSDERVRKLVAVKVASGETQTGDKALSSSHRNALIVASKPRGGTTTFIANADHTQNIRDNQDALRYPCKMQTTDRPNQYNFRERTLKHTVLVDLQSLGITYQILVRKSLLEVLEMAPSKGRILCVFPSFDEFPGLFSEAGAQNMVSRNHCQPDAIVLDDNGNNNGPHTIFKTHGITQCPGETLAKSVVDTCTPTNTVFKIRKQNCPPPYSSLPDDPTCCELAPESQVGVQHEMRVYGNRTRDLSTQLLPLVNDAYEWFKENFEIEGRIVICTDDSDPPPIIHKAFAHFLPNCSTLRLVFGTENGRERAIGFMELATKNHLVNNASFILTEAFTVDECVELLKIFPRNRTEIVFAKPPPNMSNIIRSIDEWFHTLQHRQLDIVYQTLFTFELGAFNRVWKTMVAMRGYRRFGAVLSPVCVQLRKDHVQLTIDSALASKVDTYEDTVDDDNMLTSLRFVAGAKFTPVAMEETKRGGKRKHSSSGGGASSSGRSV